MENKAHTLLAYVELWQEVQRSERADIRQQSSAELGSKPDLPRKKVNYYDVWYNWGRGGSLKKNYHVNSTRILFIGDKT